MNLSKEELVALLRVSLVGKISCTEIKQLADIILQADELRDHIEKVL